MIFHHELHFLMRSQKMTGHSQTLNRPPSPLTCSVLAVSWAHSCNIFHFIYSLFFPFSDATMGTNILSSVATSSMVTGKFFKKNHEPYFHVMGGGIIHHELGLLAHFLLIHHTLGVAILLLFNSVDQGNL